MDLIPSYYSTDIIHVIIVMITYDNINVAVQVSDDVCPWWRAMAAGAENNTAEGTLLEVLQLQFPYH